MHAAPTPSLPPCVRDRAAHPDPSRQARQQNITIGASFGEERELSFLHAGTGALTYFPQARHRAMGTPLLRATPQRPPLSAAVPRRTECSLPSAAT